VPMLVKQTATPLRQQRASELGNMSLVFVAQTVSLCYKKQKSMGTTAYQRRSVCLSPMKRAQV